MHASGSLGVHSASVVAEGQEVGGGENERGEGGSKEGRGEGGGQETNKKGDK